MQCDSTLGLDSSKFLLDGLSEVRFLVSVADRSDFLPALDLATGGDGQHVDEVVGRVVVQGARVAAAEVRVTILVARMRQCS